MKIAWLTDIHLDSVPSSETPGSVARYLVQQEQGRRGPFDAAIVTGDIATSKILAAALPEFAAGLGADALVCPVNCKGTMGAGLAKLFLARYPKACTVYRNACRRQRPLEPGGVVWAWGNPKDDVWGGASRLPRIYFAATKDDWRDPSRREWVQAAADTLVERVGTGCRTAPGLQRLALPALGCGFGELAWDDVRPVLLAAAERMAAHGVEVHVYPPHPRAVRRGAGR